MRDAISFHRAEEMLVYQITARGFFPLVACARQFRDDAFGQFAHLFIRALRLELFVSMLGGIFFFSGRPFLCLKRIRPEPDRSRDQAKNERTFSEQPVSHNDLSPGLSVDVRIDVHPSWLAFARY